VRWDRETLTVQRERLRETAHPCQPIWGDDTYFGKGKSGGGGEPARRVGWGGYCRELATLREKVAGRRRNTGEELVFAQSGKRTGLEGNSMGARTFLEKTSVVQNKENLLGRDLVKLPDIKVHLGTRGERAIMYRGEAGGGSFFCWVFGGVCGGGQLGLLLWGRAFGPLGQDGRPGEGVSLLFGQYGVTVVVCTRGKSQDNQGARKRVFTPKEH